jgi:hypothetical protein
MATFPALFDTNVLFGFHLNDLILGMAERGLSGRCGRSGSSRNCRAT